MLLVVEETLAQTDHLLLRVDYLFLNVVLDECVDAAPDFVHGQALRDQVLELVPNLADGVLDPGCEWVRGVDKLDHVVPFVRQLAAQTLALIGL